MRWTCHPVLERQHINITWSCYRLPIVTYPLLKLDKHFVLDTMRIAALFTTLLATASIATFGQTVDSSMGGAYVASVLSAMK